MMSSPDLSPPDLVAMAERAAEAAQRAAAAAERAAAVAELAARDAELASAAAERAAADAARYRWVLRTQAWGYADRAINGAGGNDAESVPEEPARPEERAACASTPWTRRRIHRSRAPSPENEAASGENRPPRDAR